MSREDEEPPDLLEVLLLYAFPLLGGASEGPMESLVDLSLEVAVHVWNRYVEEGGRIDEETIDRVGLELKKRFGGSGSGARATAAFLLRRKARFWPEDRRTVRIDQARP